MQHQVNQGQEYRWINQPSLPILLSRIDGYRFCISFAFLGQKSRMNRSESQASKAKEPQHTHRVWYYPHPMPSCFLASADCPPSPLYSPIQKLDETDRKLRAGVCNMLFSSPHLELLAPPITQFGRSILILASHMNWILEKGGYFRLFWRTIT